MALMGISQPRAVDGACVDTQMDLVEPRGPTENDAEKRVQVKRGLASRANYEEE